MKVHSHRTLVDRQSTVRDFISNKHNRTKQRMVGITSDLYPANNFTLNIPGYLLPWQKYPRLFYPFNKTLRGSYSLGLYNLLSKNNRLEGKNSLDLY